MPIGEIKTHPAASQFPLLPDDRLQTLAADISANGQRESIKLFDGMILDGRNRYAACRMASVEPRVEALPSDIDPWAYVWSLNGERRDLTADQRYLIWKSCSGQSAAWQERRQRIRDEANRKRSEALRGNDNAAKEQKTVVPLVAGPLLIDVAGDKNITPAAKASASHTNRGAVERMDRLVRERPDLAEQVRTGELPGSTAVREMVRPALIEKLESIKTREAKTLAGEYDVIVIDPPWPMQKIELDRNPAAVALDYLTMTEEELSVLPIPAARDCHVWVWATQKYLPMAMRLLDTWQLKYVCTFVWKKSGGFQPFGLPQYNCEMALYARKGAPQFIDTKNFPICFDAPRGAHSEKPDLFYETIRRVTAGRRIDIFARRVIPGFDGWGNEYPA